MSELLTLCKNLTTEGLSAPSDYASIFPENDASLRAAIAKFRGLKTDVKSDLSPESLLRLKASLILSDFTSVFVEGGTNMIVLMAAGEAPYWPKFVNIPPEVLEQHNVAMNNGTPMVFPGHTMRDDDDVAQFLCDTAPLAEAGRLLVRPHPVLLAYQNGRNEQGGRNIQILDVEPNLPDSAWIYRDSQSEQSALPLLDSAPPNPATELCTISVPYIDGVPFADLAKILDDESDSLSTFRQSVLTLLATARDDPGESYDVFNDVVRPATDKINQQFKTITTMNRLKVGGATVSAVALSLLTLSGIAIPPATSMLGAGGLIMLLAREYAEYVKSRDSLKEMPFYLAWRLRNHGDKNN
ncbi:hypothetical protein FYZ48_07035 [Gimesia chilikensis]|uniref:hypothetical protein n=1 Tax=Gimesia chilikensis TaxID=2605989 RepID=UPI0011EE11FF|nr:hypothetical protein [Gimesia chilikensis]KAA0141020.1 hypothetical protein FYZ48_07035 [Gimesia chilikensis]